MVLVLAIYITDDNPGFISGHVRMRSKNVGRYPFHYLEMIDSIFGYEPNTKLFID